MSNVEVSMDYAAMEAAARAFGEAAEVCQERINALRQVSENLQRFALLGETGNAADRMIDRLISLLHQQRGKALEMQQDILRNVALFRGDVDPGMAARFGDGSV